MPQSSDCSPTNVAPTSSPRRRILSRIASPFSRAPRAVAEFSVSIHDELRQFAPGDSVTGTVTVRIARPTRITHISVCLHGFVQVFRHSGVPGERHRPGAARHQRSNDAVTSGFTTLFEDEQVLCGDGRLTEGTYMFKYELIFPEQGLPSSIDFERGTISYMITATLTRPTTISPIIISERKIYFVERIDVATIAAPPSRTITLEPVVRRARGRHQARRLVDSARQSSDPTPFGTISAPYGTVYPENPAPASPVLSDISFDDTLSITRASQSESQYQSSLTGSDSVAITHSGVSLPSKVITATVEPAVGACLRGDHIAVRVAVNHIKQVKSLYGVIITFYRHARVDQQPERTSGPRGQRSSQHEELYPRSLTGLSGLSLSNTGSVHVFRKDLSQVMVPLFVDPQTLSAEVTAKVRVPDDAFPTISNVPGAMISFRYYVEAVLDIQGKLSGLERGLGSLQSGAPLEHVVLADAGDRDRTLQSPTGQTVVDTSAVRRDRGVVSCSFEIIVGTRNSERQRGKRRANPEAAALAVLPTAPPNNAASLAWSEIQTRHPERNSSGAHYDDMDPEWDGASASVSAGARSIRWHAEQRPSYAEANADIPPPLAPVPMPRLPDESQMSEKKRMRLIETRLLPSRPPGFDDVDGEASGTADEQAAGPTAPYLEDDDFDLGNVNIQGRAPPWAYLGSGDDLPPFTVARTWPSAPQYEPRADSHAVDAEDGETEPPHHSGRRHTNSTATPVNVGPARRDSDPVLGYEAQDDGPEADAPTSSGVLDMRARAGAVGYGVEDDDDESTNDGVEADSDAEFDMQPTHTITNASESSAKTTKRASPLSA